MNHLYCYKMPWDTGFAPNPHYGMLTLATCKPTIRRCAKVGDWISGWAAKIVHDNDGNTHIFKDGGHLIFLAKISKKVTFGEYWQNYPQKRPKKIINGKAIVSVKNCSMGCSKIEILFDVGDNIYEPRNDGEFIQHENNYHGDGDKIHDLSGKYVLICDEFYYFGVNNAIKIEYDVFPYVVPRCKKIALDKPSDFINYIKEKYVIGINNGL